jgi:hypothetical protein
MVEGGSVPPDGSAGLPDTNGPNGHAEGWAPVDRGQLALNLDPAGVVQRAVDQPQRARDGASPRARMLKFAGLGRLVARPAPRRHAAPSGQLASLDRP